MPRASEKTKAKIFQKADAALIKVPKFLIIDAKIVKNCQHFLSVSIKTVKKLKNAAQFFSAQLNFGQKMAKEKKMGLVINLEYVNLENDLLL